MNEGKAVVIERFNRTLKGRMWRYFSVRIQTNNAKHRTIKMSPVQASKKSNKSKVRLNMYGNMKPTLKKPNSSRRATGQGTYIKIQKNVREGVYTKLD